MTFYFSNEIFMRKKKKVKIKKKMQNKIKVYISNQQGFKSICITYLTEL